MQSYFVRLIAAMAVMAPVYLIIRRPFRRGGRRELFLAVFCLYEVGVLSLLLKGNYGTIPQMIASGLARIPEMQDINLLPFATICNYFGMGLSEHVIMNVLGNILLFIPWGFGLALFWYETHEPARIIAAVLIPPVLIEFFQLFIDRFVDVDDVFLNVLGSGIGVALYLLVRKVYPKIEKLTL